MRESEILIISNGDFFSTYGGGQVYVKNLVDEMIHQKMDIVVLSFVKKSSEIINKQNYKGIDLYEISELNKEKLKDLLLQVNPDIVHAHYQKAFFAILCKELNIPCVVTAHHGGITCPAGALLNHKDEICHVQANDKDCLPCVMKNTPYGLSLFYPWMKYIPLSVRLKIGRWLQKLPFLYFITPIGCASLHIQNKKRDWKEIADNVDLMIAPSEAIAENMVLNGLNPVKIRIVSHGIPIQESKSEVFESHGKVQFFYVGRIAYIKGIHILLKAFSQLDSRFCELHLIGDVDEDYGKNTMKKYKSFQNIIFHGKISPDKIMDQTKNFDVLVHPTICLEVFGLNIAEALSQKKPVIATRCGGSEMQIEDRENGLLIPPNNVDALRDAMQYLIDHREEITRMEKNTSKNVISMQKHLNELSMIYKELFSKNSINLDER